MTDSQHPITPPPELVGRWYDTIDNSSTSWKQELATQAARWGADQELEACCEWFVADRWENIASDLRTARRPKPPSLKEQALEELDKWREVIGVPQLDTIRRALEQLDD